MKDFKRTRQFVADVQALCNGIMSNEFYCSDRIHSLILDRFNKYADFDVRILSQEFINDIEVQSLQGIQDAFDVWKESLNNIVIPNYDNISFPFADYGERTVKGKEVLTWIKETCWELREIVADVIVQYNLSNNNPVENFLCAPYYEAGDIYLTIEDHAEETTYPVIPQDVLRLFGNNRNKYNNYLKACQGKKPKEIARLYKNEYGVIQLEEEKGIVTTLYQHLKDKGIVTIEKRGFQRHYENV